MSGTQTTEPSEDEVLDEALEETFPASDPPAIGGSTGPGAPMPASGRLEEA